MRLRHPDGQAVHLASSLAPQPFPDVRRLLTSLGRQATPQRRRLGSDVFDVSLNLTPAYAALLASSIGMRRRLRQELTDRGLEVVTFTVTIPPAHWRAWWSYLLDLARIVVDLLPDDVTSGSVSARLPAHPEEFSGDEAAERAGRALDDLGSGLTEITWHTGRLVRVALEAARGTLAPHTDRLVNLLAAADTGRIGVCLVPAQLAEAEEPTAQVLALLRRRNIDVVKVRLGDGTATESDASVLGALLGGGHPHCDHFEVTELTQLDVVRAELGILGLDGAADTRAPRRASS